MQKIKERFNAICVAHPILMTCAIGIFTCALLSLMFWFIVFSGLSSSAEFIYAQF